MSDLFNNQKALNKYRVTSGGWSTTSADNFGLFYVKKNISKPPLQIICSPFGEGEWEHVSVSLPDRCPSWEEMRYVKELFWSDDVTVVQFHPKKSEYVNNHPFCLHLWRNLKNEIELPPSILVGLK